MSTRRFWILSAVVFAGLTAGGLVTAGAANLLKARPTAIAVVNVQKVFEESAEKKAIEADMKGRAEALEQEGLKKQNELKQIESDLGMLAPGTPAFNDRGGELENKALEFQAWRQFQQNKLGRERVIQIEALYRKMLDGVAKVAKENGYDVVLFSEPANVLAGVKPDQIATAIQIRKVIWSAEDLDITPQVITMMNNDYTNRAGTKAGG